MRSLISPLIDLPNLGPANANPFQPILQGGLPTSSGSNEPRLFQYPNCLVKGTPLMNRHRPRASEVVQPICSEPGWSFPCFAVAQVLTILVGLMVNLVFFTHFTPKGVKGIPDRWVSSNFLPPYRGGCWGSFIHTDKGNTASFLRKSVL